MDRVERRIFTAILEQLLTGRGWVVARIPFDVTAAWPVLKRLRVRGEVEGLPIRTSLMAWSRGEGHFLLVNQKMRKALKAEVGSKVRISLEPDLEERPAAIPPELAAALKGDRRLPRWFDKLPESMRRDIGVWVGEPKSAASREQRAERMAERLLLTLEGEKDLPPILHAAFQQEPLARAGWEAMTPVQRRNHLLGIYYYRAGESRERRAAQAVEDALRVATRDGSR